MNMPKDKRNLYKLISFESFFFEEPTMETQLFCVIPATAPFIDYIKIQVESLHLFLLIR